MYSSNLRGYRDGMRRLVLALLASSCLIRSAHAENYAQLAVVKPVISCEALGNIDLTHVTDTPATIQSATLIDTVKGQFCKVLGNVKPTIGFEVDMPMSTWQQRFLMGGCGGLCGMTRVGINNAGKCAPALDGAFVVAGSDMGHTQSPGESNGAFGADPQKRIDFAYRGNHVTTLVAKALIEAFYGHAPRYSYFTGCSDGGREALMEAQRFPDDYDGVSAGAPAFAFQVQNSFYHAWMARANMRADGTTILLDNKLPVLHDAVVAHCDTLSGVNDGLLQDPRACKFDPAIVQCAINANDTSKCLTAEEVEVARRIYAGPTDAAGTHFTIGGPYLGSELNWGVPKNANTQPRNIGMASTAVQYLILPTVSAADGDITKFAFSQENFARIMELHPLYDALNTNLQPFQSRGGKLILWHGLIDTDMTPYLTIAYYEAVQNELGVAKADSFMRLYLLPGVGHCGGGDGYAQVDLLSPLMAWVEKKQAPNALLADKIAPTPRTGPPGIAGGAAVVTSPLAQPAKPALASRPLYPYPMIARYNGKGDPNVAANYRAVRTPVKIPQNIAWTGKYLIAPDNQKNYAVQDGKLVVVGSK